MLVEMLQNSASWGILALKKSDPWLIFTLTILCGKAQNFKGVRM